MNRVYKMITSGLLAALLALGGCGGGGSGQSAGIGGTGKIASGAITGFGSIFVNGVEHDVSNSSISVNESSGTESDLRIGMVVAVEGTVSGTTGTASSVRYDGEIEGPVSGGITETDGISKRFTVLATTVVVESTGTVFDSGVPGFNYDTLAANDVVEISGFYDGAGLLHATYIRKKGVYPGDSGVELKGTVSDAGAGAGLGDNFTLNGITVIISLSADLSELPGGGVTNGLFVEVHGNLVGSAITATRIQLEDASIGDDGDDISLEGLVSGYTGDPSSFLVAGQPVNATVASFEPANLQLANGLKVEVEGRLASGVLVASEIESRGGELKVYARVASVVVANALTNEGVITLIAGNGTIQVTTNSKTTLEDETGVDDSLKLNEINTSDFLEVNAYQGAGGVIATEIHRDDPDDVIVQGPVDQTVASTITILGVTFFTDAGTQFEGSDDNPLAGGAATFFGIDRTGDIVKIKDDAPGDGIADEVDLED